VLTSYTDSFYARRAERIERSAKALVPVLVELFAPWSVVDVGCGDGTWLRSFAGRGIEVAGMDGPWVPKRRLRIDEQHFFPIDLGKAPLPYAIELPRVRYDLLISLEVLEHVQAERGDALVDLMTSLSDTLVVSAAAPDQGGTRHVNERWPDYWAAKFRTRGFEPFDFLRYAVWNDERIAPWYRQNVIGYFRSGVPDAVREFAERGLNGLLEYPLPLCHPGVFGEKLGRFRRALRNPIGLVIAELKRRREH
jgi:SAM-dependent methyltransferase